MPPAARPPLSRALAIGAALLVFVVIPLLGAGATFYTDALWFAELGQTGVFWTTLASRVVTGGVFALVVVLVVYSNLRIARRMAPRVVLSAVDDLESPASELLRRIRSSVDPWVDRGVLGLTAVLAVVLGVSMSTHWDVFRLAFEGGAFGQVDPQFGLDIGFYVFTLPALRLVTDWLLSLLLVTLAATVALHVVDGAIRLTERWAGFAPHVKSHVSALLGLIVLTKAADYWLRIYELVFSGRGQVTGASYTDVHAQLPALRILIVIALATALALLVNLRFRGWRLPLLSLGVWAGASVLVGGVYPALVQQVRVAPNEVAAEAPYIAHNIAATRAAFGLDQVETRQFVASADLTAKDVVANRGTLSNVRLWDPGIVIQSYRQLQAMRPYYDFIDVDVDRYQIGGQRRQVLVSAREMNVSRLADQARTWVNEHLVYTHGYGLVMSPVSEATGRGLPGFVLRDIPPQASDESIAVKRPQIYYGEGDGGYVVVGTGIDEFDYPVGDQNATTRYDGAAGVAVGGIVRRAAFALRFGSWQFLFSDYIEPESRVLFARQLRDRVGRVAPWLGLDKDPYPIVVDGRIIWVMDGYTISARYPYSEPMGGSGGVNYIRNSVKVTVDAYDGTVTLYASDDDPIRDAWSRVFPGLISPGEQMPKGVREHLRYPEDLFRVQAEVYKNYHMLDPQVFYNKEDTWSFPGEGTDNQMEPYYVLMRLPGDREDDFLMMMPFTPRTRDNMIGWLAARSDPGAYGERIALKFPKQRLVLGPQQISAQVNQDPVISPQITLWGQAGSEVIFGNMLVIPLEDSVVFVQPLFLQAQETAIPELTRVIVAYGDHVVMEETLEEGLLAIFGAEEREGSGETTASPPAADASVANDLFRRAVEAQKRGDWAEYGRLIGELGRILEALAGLSGEATPTPTP